MARKHSNRKAQPTAERGGLLRVRKDVSLKVHPRAWERFALMAERQHERSPEGLLAALALIGAAGLLPNQEELTARLIQARTILGLHLESEPEQADARALADKLWATLRPRRQ